MQPYRVPSPPAKRKKKAPSPSLVYVTSDHSKGALAVRAVAPVALGGGLVSVLVASAGAPPLSILTMLATIALSLYRWRGAATKVEGITFLVVNDELEIIAPNGASILRARLTNVRDVVLDSKRIEKVQDGNALDVAIRGESRVHPELDISRIVVVHGKRRDEIILTEAYGSHSEALEWLGKIRTFLRSHGWEPQDERRERRERLRASRESGERNEEPLATDDEEDEDEEHA